DNSREMLAKAQGALTRELKARVSFVHGEAEDLAASGATLDLIVMNMVLHHLPSPARLFRTASQLLNPAGRLLIIDLRPHNQDWARDICGDLWLGFEPSDLEDWAAEAGLERGQSVYLGLKNGFQIQVRLFHKPQT
ncbi:MAG: class I SAM-dependent methyltransferase, partial [Pseudomonadales bacterium]